MAITQLGKFVNLNDTYRIRLDDIESYFPVDPVNPDTANPNSQYKIIVRTEEDSNGQVRVNLIPLMYDTEIDRDNDLTALDGIMSLIGY